ncbi:TLR adapter interacting with SLC15A4 on the lysosome-like [Sceloporus undulatus]|uniref:TLR adapter interacting with SLC15A4 on the lysosome-like n=1 Tax=Sceloporus undulatus TaxID=8520 RepID=UPI001C4D8E9A|nr:TLR adapter interacting with SLC15A4 on the lysosome-like [Sceloporus undulatus]XP_042333654.1 TLR adapter interacting with SLC15A4 on the lysosome-like [Sceloporus undulatus]
MLAESFLTGFAYTAELPKSHCCVGATTTGGVSWKDQLIDDRDIYTESKRVATEKLVATYCEMEVDQDASRQNLIKNPPLTNGSNHLPLSAPQPIARREQHCEKELDLYRSWSCQSLYQNYPDLRIRGDHIADHTCDSGCIIDQSYNELPAGPVLLSKDIPLGYSSVNESLQKSRVIKFWRGEETGEKSLALHKEPLSNSILNNYMETKVQEFYKQFLEEKLTRCNSLNHFVTSNLLMSNISELPPEQHNEASKALLQSLALFGLQNPGGGNSDEFSTPNLQISALLCKKKSAPVQSAS